MTNVMAAQPSIGSALCKSSVIRFLVPRPLLECRAVKLPIYENATLARKVNSAPGKIPSEGQEPLKMYRAYIVYQSRRRPNIMQFGWPPVSNITAARKARRETR